MTADPDLEVRMTPSLWQRAKRKLARKKYRFDRRNQERLDHAWLAVLGRVAYERRMFRRHVGYAPDLRNPRSYNEKIAWRKLYQVMPAAPMLSDKLAVRDFVASRVGERYLKDVIAVYERAEDIDFDALPNAFAAKCTHGSSMNVFVSDKQATDLEAARRTLADFLAIRDYGRHKNEWWYAKIKPRIVIEPLLTDRRYGFPAEYKFHVFDGDVKLVALNFNRSFDKADFVQTYYDRDWRHLSLSRTHAVGSIMPRPDALPEMLEVAETLAKDVDYFRVDLYCLDDSVVVFSEITLAGGAGWLRVTPQSADFEIGSYWKLRPRVDIRLDMTAASAPGLLHASQAQRPAKRG
jgi:hypothetical protein